MTLTGVGGAGKTRLALRAANLHAESAGVDGLFASLESVQDARRLPRAVVRALGLADQSTRDPLDVVIEALTEQLNRAAAWRSKPVTYVLTENDKILPPPVQEMLAARTGGDVVRIPHGHNPFGEDPVAFAALLARIAAPTSVAT
ncbi:MAG: alpha/beta fold hydrolase [Pseudolysinimonas sp.]|uniref:alpha/beta fold hydrolase n=1 Tax=Pseudolysinimonas sp. TaxID=2680009 RepID=UPI003C7092A1